MCVLDLHACMHAAAAAATASTHEIQLRKNVSPSQSWMPPPHRHRHCAYGTFYYFVLVKEFTAHCVQTLSDATQKNGVWLQVLIMRYSTLMHEFIRLCSTNRMADVCEGLLCVLHIHIRVCVCSLLLAPHHIPFSHHVVCQIEFHAIDI